MGKKTIKLADVGNAMAKILDEYKDESEAATELAIKESVFRVWGNIIGGTPVDSGRARANWFIDSTPTGLTTESTLDKGESYVRAKVEHWTIDKKIYLFNNLPYIGRLEFGHSDQARNPDGMVRLNLQLWPKVLQDRFKKNQQGIK